MVRKKKESVVGSVQMVKPDELKVPSSQLSTGFAGRLAGVVAVQRSGEPGADGADFLDSRYFYFQWHKESIDYH